MSIKIKLRENRKAMVKFDKPVDEQYFTWVILTHRDDGQHHPEIIFKNREGDTVPPLPKPPKIEPKLPVIADVRSEAPKVEPKDVQMITAPVSIKSESAIKTGMEIGLKTKPEEKKDELA